jgi:hypothetical protein
MKTLNILGKGPGWSTCPEPTTEVPVWSMTNIITKRTAVTKVFEIHDLVEKFSRGSEGMIHQEAARYAAHLGITYVVSRHWDWLGCKQEIYPLEKVIAAVGTDYLGCSLDLMIALAIVEGYQHINLYGMGQQRGDIYDYQLDSTNFWLGYCMGRGINFEIHHWGGVQHTDLMRTIDGHIYGLKVPQRPMPYSKVTKRCTCTLMPQNKRCVCFVKEVNNADYIKDKRLHDGSPEQIQGSQQGEEEKASQ